MDEHVPLRDVTQLADEFRRVIQRPNELDAGHANLAEQAGLQGVHRLQVYRTLVRRGIVAAVRAELPRTTLRMGSLLDMTVERWLDEVLPESPYVRDIAAEFVAWAGPKWANDASIPKWMGDFARYEALTFEVAAAEGGGSSAGPLAIDRGASFDGAVRLARFDWAVHRVPESLDVQDKPDAEPVALLVYRDASHDVRRLVLSPLAAAIIDRLLGGQTLGAAVTDACRMLEVEVDDAVLRSTAECLADLADRGVLLGGRSTDA